MNSDPKSRELLTCVLLHLDPRIADKRTVLNSILVEVALFLIDGSASLEEIHREVDTIVNQRSFLSREELSSAIEDCLGRGDAIDRDEKYELSTTRRDTLQAAFLFADRTKEQVCSELIESVELEVGDLLDPALAGDICESVKRGLTSKVYELSLELVRENPTMEEMLLRLDVVEPLDDLEQALNAHIPPDRHLFRRQIKEGIIDYFQRFPPHLEDMLKLIHHTVLINQILNIDPSMVRLQREWFSRRRLYLDTNVVLGYIFEGQEFHLAVLDVIQSTIALQVQLLISPATLRELQRQVQRAKRNHIIYEKDPLAHRMAIHGDDAILATFARLHRKQPSLNWEAFIAPFEELEEALFQYDILVEKEGFEQAQTSDKLDRIRNAITQAKSSSASDDVIEHDSLNCALIMHLREIYPPDERGQVVWLLTNDRSLKKAQRILHGANDIAGPFCIQADEWGEIVLPVQGAAGFVFKDFIGYLAQARLGAIADSRIIQFDFLETIRDAEIDIDRLLKLHSDQVRTTLIHLQTNREVRSLATDSARAQDEAQKQAYRQQLELLFDDAIEETDPVSVLKQQYDRRISLLEQHVRRRDERIAEQDEKITELDTRLAKAESTWGFRVSSWIRGILRQN